MEIGKKLKNARVQSGMTQENVAEKINVSRQTISNWENEKSYPDIISVIELSIVFPPLRRRSIRYCGLHTPAGHLPGAGFHCG